MSDDLDQLWLDDEEDAMTVDVMDLRRRASARERDVALRNLVEVFAAGIVVATFGSFAVRAPTLLGAWGSGLIALAGGFVAAVLAYRGGSLRHEPAQDTLSFVQHEREQLEHQARLLERAPLWYVGPFVPGLALISAANWPGPDGALLWGGSVALQIAVLVGVSVLNLRAARTLRRQIDELPDV